MLIRTAVIEDEPKEQENTVLQLNKYAAEKDLVMEVDCYDDGADFLENYQNQYDIIICDIQMKFTDGIETAEMIRKQNEDVIIIFVTNRSEFSIQGYEVDAAGDILKPLAYPMLKRYLDRSLKRLKTKDVHYLVLTTGKNVLRIDIDKILYIESIKHYQYIHTEEEEHKVLITLKELEEKLNSSAFCRCSNGCLVHLKHVKKLEKNDVYVGNDMLGISRNRKKDFTEALTDYMTNEM